MTSDVIATGIKYRYQFATKAKLIFFKHILSSIFMNNRVIVIDNRQKFFQLQLSTFENIQLQLQQSCVINYNFVYYSYNFPSLCVGTFCYQYFLFSKVSLCLKCKLFGNLVYGWLSTFIILISDYFCF